MGDLKTNDGKIRVELVPWELMEQAGCAMTYGVDKHGHEGTWREGVKGDGWQKYTAAAFRHLGSYFKSRLAGGDGRDPESGLSHLAGAAASISILCWAEAQRGNLPAMWQKPPRRAETAPRTRLDRARRRAAEFGAWVDAKDIGDHVMRWRLCGLSVTEETRGRVLDSARPVLVDWTAPANVEGYILARLRALGLEEHYWSPQARR